MPTPENASSTYKAQISDITRGLGVITVSGATSLTRYICTADGATADDAPIAAAFAAAIADMPARVEFGPGDYAIDGGFAINPVPGSRGLTIVGSGPDVTRLTFSKGSSLVAGEFIAFDIRPSVGSIFGSHITTGNNAALIVSTENLVASAYATGYTVYNLTDGSSGVITANTTTTVTATLSGGTDDDWDIGDRFEIRRTASSIKEDDYLRDIQVSGFGFYDDDPSTHGGGGEESHGVSIRYASRSSVTNCHFQDIGDEGIDFNRCLSYEASNNTSENTPSDGASGAAISVSDGCSGGVIIGNRLYGTSVPGTQSVLSGQNGISVSLVIDNDIDDCIIANNIIRDFTNNGVQLNCAAAADLVNITINANTIRNCDNAVKRLGSSGISYFTSITSNTISDMQATGIDFPVAAANNLDCNVAFNTIENTINNGIGIRCDGTRLNLSGNNISSLLGVAIYITQSVDVLISGGILNACGGGTGDGDRVINDTNATTSTVVEGVNLVNCNSATAIIDGVKEVSDCHIESTAQLDGNRGVDDVQFVRNNNLVNTGLRVLKAKSIVTGNHIILDDDPTTSIIRGGALDDCIYTSNLIEVSASTGTPQDGIETTGEYCITANNNVRNGTTGVTNAGTGAVNVDNVA